MHSRHTHIWFLHPWRLSLKAAVEDTSPTQEPKHQIQKESWSWWPIIASWTRTSSKTGILEQPKVICKWLIALHINNILNKQVEISIHSCLTESYLKLTETYFCQWPDHQSTSNMASTTITSLLSDPVACLWSIYQKLFHHPGQLIIMDRRYHYSNLKLSSCLQSKFCVNLYEVYQESLSYQKFKACI